jgi:hypothetical protein
MTLRFREAAHRQCASRTANAVIMLELVKNLYHIILFYEKGIKRKLINALDSR